MVLYGLWVKHGRHYRLNNDEELNVCPLIYFTAELEAGAVGLALSYAVTLTGMFQWGVRQSAEIENMVRALNDSSCSDPTSPKPSVIIRFQRVLWDRIPTIHKENSEGQKREQNVPHAAYKS